MQKNALAVLMVVVGLIGGTFIGWGVSAVLIPAGSQTIFIEITGSTTCEPVITTCSEKFMMINPNVDISVTGTGSGSGIADTISSLNDIGMSSRNIKASENTTAGGILVDYQFAKDGIAVIIDADHPDAAWLELNGLTMEEVFKIYNGTYTHWINISGTLSDETIDCYTRPDGSGTRATFEELVTFGGDELGDDAGYQTSVTGYTQVSSNSLMVQGVSGNNYGFGYCGLGYIDATVIAVPVDGVTPSVATILDNSYPISRALHLLTNGPATGWVQAFLDYIYGPYGQEVVAEEGFIRLWF
ncbi:MAG: phosphate ABC transporter substrate-binding protein [Promethearchaeota archaeon]|nr:MAG: phosphate ABC transporter substrate-binding protein [Candidatus Lokiarchaeota archaeon]